MTGYPLSYYKDKKWIYLFAAGFMFADEKNKKAMIKDIKKQPEFVNIDVNKNFMLLLMKQPLWSESIYDPKIIRPKPIIINKSGYHVWDLASFDRELLINALKVAEKYLGAEVLKLKEEKISNISFSKLLPDLTKNQKKALEIAINDGYYNYPKNTKMETLAKKMGISYSTYQAHLKKAEGKIMPEVYKEL